MAGEQQKVVVTGEPVKPQQTPAKTFKGRLRAGFVHGEMKVGEEVELTENQARHWADKFEVTEGEASEPRKGDSDVPPGGYQRAQDASSKQPDLSLQPNTNTSVSNSVVLTERERAALRDLEEEAQGKVEEKNRHQNPAPLGDAVKAEADKAKAEEDKKKAEADKAKVVDKK